MLLYAGIRICYILLIRAAVLPRVLRAVVFPLLLRLHKGLGVPLLQLQHPLWAREALKAMSAWSDLHLSCNFDRLLGGIGSAGALLCPECQSFSCNVRLSMVFLFCHDSPKSLLLQLGHPVWQEEVFRSLKIGNPSLYNKVGGVLCLYKGASDFATVKLAQAAMLAIAARVCGSLMPHSAKD